MLSTLSVLVTSLRHRRSSATIIPHKDTDSISDNLSRTSTSSSEHRGGNKLARLRQFCASATGQSNSLPLRCAYRCEGYYSNVDTPTLTLQAYPPVSPPPAAPPSPPKPLLLQAAPLAPIHSTLAISRRPSCPIPRLAAAPRVSVRYRASNVILRPSASARRWSCSAAQSPS